MSRIRSIHPDLFTDEAFVEISFAARLLLLGLGTEADDQGAFQWKPTGLRLKIFPGDPVDVQELLKELESVDFVRRFRSDDGREFGCIRNFCRHQKPKRPNAKFPVPEELHEFISLHENSYLASESSEHVGKHSGTCPPGEEGRGEERRGEKGSGVERKSARASRLPSDFEPKLTPKAQEIVSGWPKGLLERELDKFRDHHTAKGSTFKDWQAAFRTWIANAEQWRNRNGNGNRNAGSTNGLLDACTE